MSTEGRVRRRYADGRTRPLRPNYTSQSKNQAAVRLYDGHGKGKRFQVLRLVVMTFFPGQIEGKWVIHRNGLHEDNSIWNVRLVAPGKCGQLFGGKRRKAVRMVNADGEVVEIYPSVTAASAAHGITRGTVVRHCDRLNTRPLPRDISFRWDVEKPGPKRR